MRRTLCAALLTAATAITLTACSGEAEPKKPDPVASAYRFNALIGLNRKDTGVGAGSVKFLEVVVMPKECVDGTTQVPVLGLRVELVNGANESIAVPDNHSLRMTDATGNPVVVGAATLKQACSAQFPEIRKGLPGINSTGWVAVSVTDVQPAKLAYSPSVVAQDHEGASFAELKPIGVNPESVTMAFPTIGRPEPRQQPDTTAQRTPSAPPTTKAAAASEVDCGTGATTSGHEFGVVAVAGATGAIPSCREAITVLTTYFDLPDDPSSGSARTQQVGQWTCARNAGYPGADKKASCARGEHPMKNSTAMRIRQK